MNTLDFYNADPEGYADATFGADTSHLRDRFVRFLHHGSRILDLGCGSGRDTIAFRQAGFEVVPVDGSEGMCRVAESNTGSEVRMIDFMSLDYEGEFDGVWACSSLLHLSSDVLPQVLGLVHRSLRCGGVFYTSFKEGTFEGVRGDRYYTDMTIEDLDLLLSSNGFEPIDMWTSLEPGRDVRWVNAVSRRV